jgi:hypothetical protein
VDYHLIKLGVLLRYGGLARHPLLRGLPDHLRDNIAKRFIFSPKHGFTYQRVPKAANSTIARTLAAHILGNEAIRRDGHGARAKGRLRRLPSPEQFADSFSFTFVRDPATRVLLAWRDKGHNTKYMRRYGLEDPKAPGKPIAFSDFLRRLDAGLLDKDLHWCPQTLMLVDGGQAFDFVGRVERIETDLPHVMERIFGSAAAPATSPVDRTGASARAAQDISADDMRLIRRLYAEDYAFIAEL